MLLRAIADILLADTYIITVKAGFVKSYVTQKGDGSIKSEMIGALLGLSIGSNIWLWINLWNLKNELFRFEADTVGLLKGIFEPTESDAGGEQVGS